MRKSAEIGKMVTKIRKTFRIVGSLKDTQRVTSKKYMSSTETNTSVRTEAHTFTYIHINIYMHICSSYIKYHFWFIWSRCSRL